MRGMQNEANFRVWRLGRMGCGGSGGRVVEGGVLRGVPVYRGGGAGGVGGGMRNEPNFRVFRSGRISYGGVHAGLLPPASPATCQFPKVVEEGWHVTREALKGVGVGIGGEAGAPFGLEGEAGAVADAVAAAIGLDLCLRCHRASASSTVAGEPARFRGVG